MTPYFSIILPSYNVAPYLERCIRSVLEQDFHDYEMILVDDGSTDESGSICDDFAAGYDHIRVVHKANGGLSSARNAGTEIARGEYIWWVDSDDWIEKDSLSLLHQVTARKKPDIVKFSHVRVTTENITVSSEVTAGEYIGRESIEQLMQRAFLKTSKYILSAWSHVYKRQFLKEHDLVFASEREIGSEDYLFNLQALLQANHILVLPNAIYFYEQRMGSLTQRYKKDAPRKYTELYRQLKAYYLQADALKQYESLLSTFYVWHLLHGICIPNEYYLSEDHTLEEGRKNIAYFLLQPEVKQAAKQMEWSHFTWKQKIQLLAMRWHMEWLLYWLYVQKPRLRKG